MKKQIKAFLSTILAVILILTVFGTTASAVEKFTKPDKPTVTKTTITKNIINITIASSKNADNFYIYASSKKDGTYKVLGKIAASPDKSVSYSSKPLKAGTVYFKVRAAKTVDGKDYGGDFTKIYKAQIKAQPKPTPAVTSVTDSKSGIFPIKYKAFGIEYSITGYKIGIDSAGNTTITIYGSGYNFIRIENGSMQVAAWGEYEAGGNTYKATNASNAVIPEDEIGLIYSYNSSVVPDKITIINNDTDEEIISFNVKDVPQS